MRILGR